MLAERRHQLILRALRSGGPAAVTALAEQLGVSQATIRRDLVNWRTRACSRGCTAARSPRTGDQPFAEVAEVRVAEKDAIAARAARDWSRTARPCCSTSAPPRYRLARQLHGRRLTVITSNLAVYEELAGRRGHRAGAARRHGPPRLPLPGRLPHRGQPAPAPRRLAVPRHQRGAARTGR